VWYRIFLSLFEPRLAISPSALLHRKHSWPHLVYVPATSFTQNVQVTLSIILDNKFPWSYFTCVGTQQILAAPHIRSNWFGYGLQCENTRYRNQYGYRAIHHYFDIYRPPLLLRRYGFFPTNTHPITGHERIYCGRTSRAQVRRTKVPVAVMRRICLAFVLNLSTPHRHTFLVDPGWNLETVGNFRQHFVEIKWPFPQRQPSRHVYR